MPTTTLTINLKKKLIRLHTARRRRRAVSLVKEAVARFSKTDIDKIKIDPGLNEFIERNASGASYLWAKLKVNVEKGTDTADVKLYTAKAVAATAAAASPKPEAKKPGAGDKKAEKKA
jgi:ribosomal protein L31E